MVTTGTQVERRLAIVVVLTTMVCLIVTVFAAYCAATLEFTCAVSIVENHAIPEFTSVYGDVYVCAWGVPAIGMIWGLWLARKPCCSLLSLTVYVAAACIFMVSWLVYTLLAFYLVNQSFLVGSSF